MKEYSLGLYEKSMPSGMDFSVMLSSTRECGFDTLEISIDESDSRLARLDWTKEQRLDLRKKVQDSGVAIKTMCLSGHRKYPLGSHDEKTREHSLDVMRKAIEFAAEQGIRLIQLAGYDVYYEEGDDTTRAYFGENLRKSAEYAALYGVSMGFETMETSFMDTVGKAMYWVDKVNIPYLGVYPDIGNLQNAAVLYGTDILDDIKSGTGHIMAAHLKETVPGVYRDMDFGTGHTQYLPCIKELYKMGVRHFTGEFWYKGEPDYKKTLSAASAFLREKIETATEQI